MRKSLGWSLFFIGLALAAAIVVLKFGRDQKMPASPPVPQTAQSTYPPVALAASPPNIQSSNIHPGILELANQSARKSAKLLTQEERADFETRYNAQLKPAIQKWCAAYEGHLPFKLQDVTLDRFVEQIARNRRDGLYAIYTFVVDGVTLCVESRVNGEVVVNYMYAPKAKQLMNLPTGGHPPTLKLPVERDAVIKMIQADSGVRFAPAELVIRATGLGSALNGGAAVDIPLLRNGTETGFSKVSMVFDPDGTLCYYDRDPTF